MSARRRHREVLREIEALNARIDDLVGLITSQIPDDELPCSGWNQDVDGELIGSVIIPNNVRTQLVPGVSVLLKSGCNVPAHYRIAGLPVE